MVTSTEDFLQSFHSLDGITIGEKRKNLYLLLNSINNEDIDFNSIQPKNPLEENFKIEALIYFKKVPELIEAFKSENPTLIKIILKRSSWIIEDMLKFIDGCEFIEQVFPHLSFNAKTKVINKFAIHLTDTLKTDKIYNVLYNTYGSYLAGKLLPCCSETVIVDALKTSKIEITCRQLLTMVKKNLAAAEGIFEALNEYLPKNTIQYKYRIVFKFIAQNDLSLFLCLNKLYKTTIKIGWRLTGNIISQNQDLALKNSKDLFNVLHQKQMLKSFSGNFNELYFNVLPTLDELKDNYNLYLDLLSCKQSKLDLFLTVFEKKYNTQLWEESEFITPGFLELMSFDEREEWMNLNEKPKHFNEESWICLMKIEKSIPCLKKKISLTSDMQERAEIAGCLVETCRINNDKTALLDVLKYILHQHKNDFSSVLFSLITTIKKSFNIYKLSEEHWKYINDIIDIFIARHEMQCFYLEWLGDYIRFCILKEKEMKPILIEMSKRCVLDNFYVYPLRMNISSEKEFLIGYAEIITKVTEESNLENSYVQLLNVVAKWNKVHPKNQIPLKHFKSGYDILLQFLNKDYPYRSENIPEIVFAFYTSSDFEENEKNELLQTLLKSKHFCYNMHFFEWIIKYHPLLVQKYIDEIQNYILDLWYTALKPFFWKCCKNYYHLEIPQKIISNCLSILNNEEESASKKKNGITALSYLMEPETFINVINPYYPSDFTIDLKDKSKQEMYKIQQAITVSLKNVIPPSKAMDSVLIFSKGDYLKYVQRSLYSISHNVAEIRLVDFFSGLIDTPVSVRKHVIFLGFKVLNRNEIYKILKSMEDEKNSSICKFLFRASFNYFNKNPNDTFLWENIKRSIRSVDVNDSEAFDILMDITKVPNIALVQYITFTWDFLETHCNSKNMNFISAKCLLLNSINTKLVPSISKEFSLDIIEKYFLKLGGLTEFHKSVINFTVKVMIYSTDDQNQDEYLIVVFDILKNYISSCDWKDQKAIEAVIVFVKEFCDHFNKNPTLNNNVLKKFLDMWSNILQPHQAFEEFLNLNFALIFTEPDIKAISVKVTEFCNSVLETYGTTVADLFCVSLKCHVTAFLQKYDDCENSLDLKEENLFSLMENIIESSNSINCMLAVLTLLPRNIPRSLILREKYLNIMKELENCTDLRVQLILSVYLECPGSDEDETISMTNNGLKRRSKRGYLHFMIEHFSSKYKK